MTILSEENSVLASTVNFFGKNSSGFQSECHMNVFLMRATCSVHFILNFIITYEYLLRNANSWAHRILQSLLRYLPL